MDKNNYQYLLVGLLVFLAAEPLLGGAEQSGALIQLAFTAILLAGVFSLAANPGLFRLAIALATIAFGTAVAYFVTGLAWVRLVDLAAVVCFLVVAIGVTIKHVVITAGPVTTNRVVGALCLYLLLGVLWTVLFALVELSDPSAFSYSTGAAGDPVEQFLYYSFVTLTTLGYGDVTPVHPAARTLAYLEALVGQLYIAVLVASLVGRHAAGMHTRSDEA